MEVINKNPRKPTVLLILDGLGVDQPNSGNAVTLANTPNLDSYWPKYPHTYLQASGNYVGLPQGIVGNSEVGHLSLGAGRIVFQEIARIDNAIANQSFFENETFKESINHAKQNNSKIHFMGLVSNGRVHSSDEHLHACLEFCKKEGIDGKKVFVHAFTDGRDTPTDVAGDFLEELEAKMKSFGVGRIASIIGRYFAMDRDDRWDRTKKAYDLIVSGIGQQMKHWKQAIDDSYSKNITDEYIEPYVITENGEPITKVNQGDTVIFFNYRADRAVQLSKAFVKDDFNGWQRSKIQNLYYAGFSNYQKGIVMNREHKEDIEALGGESKMIEKLFELELQNQNTRFPKNQIFPPEKVQNSLGAIISNAGLAQLRIAESEKYPHITYFFNCRNSNPFEREERIEIPSPKEVATYDQKPEMSNYETTDRVLQELEKGIYDFTLVNFALTDMVAHTGNLEASIKAVEVADKCAGLIVQKVLEKGGQIIITSDHGNIEGLTNLQTGEVDTQHSTNPVPFMFISHDTNLPKELQVGMLADIGPTVLDLMGIDKPNDMVGRNLLY